MPIIGGPAFLQPIQAADAIQTTLSYIFPLSYPPQVVVTALRALKNVTEAAELSDSPSACTDALAELIFRPLYLDAFNSILGSESATADVQEQKRLVAGLIGRLCKKDKHQNALANNGILDALATMLASFVVARGEVVPGAEVVGRSDGMDKMIPDPAPRGANLAATLDAISAIITESRFRTCMLICSPAVMAVFPNTEFKPTHGSHSLRRYRDLVGLTGPRKQNPEAMEYLLPVVPARHAKGTTMPAQSFPPLGVSKSGDNLSSMGQADPKGFSAWDPTRFVDAPAPGGADGEADEAESPLVPWLIHLVRSSSSIERVMAASVLASLFKAGFAAPHRESAIGNLVVPVLCRLIKEAHVEAQAKDDDVDLLEQRVALNRSILERCPTVLARLIAGSEPLQVCAHACGAVEAVCNILTESYESMPEQSPTRPWSPMAESDAEEDIGGDNGLAAVCMGPPGHLPLYYHRIKLREGSLKLIAAIISQKEYIRTAFVEQDVVSYIVGSLSPTPENLKSGKDKAKTEGSAARDVSSSAEDSPYGTNPSSVLIAACHVIRLLSRSISILRTSLEDHGITSPIFKLLRHSDKDVQVAACSVVCNLVMEMSPMRQVSRELVPVISFASDSNVKANFFPPSHSSISGLSRFSANTRTRWTQSCGITPCGR